MPIAPSHHLLKHWEKKILKLCRELHLSDGLRSDRSIAAFGLELRVPFTDKAFIAYVLSLDPAVKDFWEGAS